jgi:hypothetical protein
MAKFVLSARGGEEELANYSPEQLQVLMQRYRAWLVDVRERAAAAATFAVDERACAIGARPSTARPS